MTGLRTAPFPSTSELRRAKLTVSRPAMGESPIDV